MPTIIMFAEALATLDEHTPLPTTETQATAFVQSFVGLDLEGPALMRAAYRRIRPGYARWHVHQRLFGAVPSADRVSFRYRSAPMTTAS